MSSRGHSNYTLFYSFIISSNRFRVITERERLENPNLTTQNNRNSFQSSTLSPNAGISPPNNHPRSSSLDSSNNTRRNANTLTSNSHSARTQIPVSSRISNTPYTPIHPNHAGLTRTTSVDNVVSLFTSEGSTLTHNQLSILNSPIDPTTVTSSNTSQNQSGTQSPEPINNSHYTTAIIETSSESRTDENRNSASEENANIITQNEIAPRSHTRDTGTNMSFGDHNHAFVTNLAQRNLHTYDLRNRAPHQNPINDGNNNRGRQNTSPPRK